MHASLVGTLCILVKLYWTKRSKLLLTGRFSENWMAENQVESGKLFSYERIGLMNTKDNEDDYQSISATSDSS